MASMPCSLNDSPSIHDCLGKPFICAAVTLARGLRRIPTNNEDPFLKVRFASIRKYKPKDAAMRAILQHSRSPILSHVSSPILGARRFLRLLLALPVVLCLFPGTAVVLSAQQSAPASSAQSSAPAQVSTTPPAGAPALGFKAPAPVSTKSAAQEAPPKPRPKFDPATGAPFSDVASRPTAIEDASAGQAGNASGIMASDGSIHQGLKVHGHWVINISNPDGTQVQHHEFENSLETGAQGFLVGLLSGYMVPGDWMVVLGAQSGSGPCNGPSYQFCGLVHNTATYPAQGYCNVYYCTGSTLNYTYNFGTGFAGPFSIVLSGSTTSNQTGTIGTVFTLLNTCANIGFSAGVNPSSVETSSPSSCIPQTNPTPWYGPFTSTNITPIAVTSGQLIQVIVTITFS